MKTGRIHRSAGYTLVELLVGMLISLLCMGVVFQLIQTGNRLASRNLATNLGHLNTLNPMQRLTADIHSAITIPQLTGPLTSGTFPLVTGTGPAEGISMQIVAFGPYAVFNNSSSTSKDIQIDLQGATMPNIVPGMHVVIPSYGVDKEITSVTTGVNPRCSFATTLGVTITTQGGTGGGSNGTQLVPLFLTMPIQYYVSGSNLIRREGSGTNKTVMFSLLRTGTSSLIRPFTKPTSDNRYVQVCLAGGNSEYGNQKYKASNMLYYNIWIPFRGQLNWSTTSP